MMTQLVNVSATPLLEQHAPAPAPAGARLIDVCVALVGGPRDEYD